MPETILVVDDDPTVRRLIKLVLSTSGFEVEEADSGDEALRKMKKVTPDLIVLDLMMPGMTAKEFVQKSRASGYDNPVLVLSAHYAGIEVGLLIGADDAMEKPFMPEELEQRIRRLLARVTDTAG